MFAAKKYFQEEIVNFYCMNMDVEPFTPWKSTNTRTPRFLSKCIGNIDEFRSGFEAIGAILFSNKFYLWSLIDNKNPSYLGTNCHPRPQTFFGTTKTFTELDNLDFTLDGKETRSRASPKTSFFLSRCDEISAKFCFQTCISFSFQQNFAKTKGNEIDLIMQ
jgi:hypothetical protein